MMSYMLCSLVILVVAVVVVGSSSAAVAHAVGKQTGSELGVGAPGVSAQGATLLAAESPLDRAASAALYDATGGAAEVVAQSGVPPATDIMVRKGSQSGEVIISWDAVAQATYYRIGYVNMEVDYHFAKASCTGEWIEAFVYVDVNARNIPVNNGRAEYTVRRVDTDARHAFTVLVSNDFVDTGRDGSVSSEFFWPPSGSRWEFLPGKNALPAGVTIPMPDCSAAPEIPSPATDRAALVALYNDPEANTVRLHWH